MPLIDKPTGTGQVFAANSSEASSLNGHKAKTPIIAGSVCAILLVIAWSVALVSYIVRRNKKKTRAKKVAAGIKPPKPVPQPPQKYIIPPDPAVVLGQGEPGEHIIVESKHKNGRRVKHSKTMPETQESHDGEGSEKTFGKLAHSNTEPFSERRDHHPPTNGGYS